MNPRWAPLLFGLLLSGMMSFMVSGVATFRAIGLPPDFLRAWIVDAWPPSWAIAFPAATLLAPLVRRLVAKIVRQDETYG